MNNLIFFTFHSLAHRSVFLDWLIVFTADLFSYLSLFLLVCFLFFYEKGFFVLNKSLSWFKEKTKNIFIIFLVPIISWLITIGIKNFFLLPRPFIVFEDLKPLFLHGGMESFPSGHAAIFSALAVTLLFKNRRIGILYVFIAVLISLARIISGIHFPVDVLVGWVIGVSTALIFQFFIKNK